MSPSLSPSTSPISPARLSPPTETEIAQYRERAATSSVQIMTTQGVMTFELFPDAAPIHVANFMKLAESGFYTNLTFHRVEPGFVVQGGDPNGDGTGGPGYQIPAEFNDHNHRTGTLAMARSRDPNSAGSQFYITLAPQPALDGQYTVFGQIVTGADIPAKIQRGDLILSMTIIPRGG